MNSQNSNPFALPGFGQTGDLSSNPLLASMEMMSRAWEGMAGSGVLSQSPMAPALTTEDLDRRIGDLRAVENWLRINMSMLSSSIQALEVQRATIATLKSFANVPGASTGSADNPSPLEVALGLKPSGQAKIKTPAQAQPGSADSAAQEQPALPADPAALSEAAQGWWNMLQQQFDSLTSATVASMQAAQNASADTPGDAPEKKPARKAASKATSKTVNKPASKPAAAKPRAARTASAKTPSAKK